MAALAVAASIVLATRMTTREGIALLVAVTIATLHWVSVRRAKAAA
jgi:hypothetical protein